jgi:putative ABC transport system permease protein
MPEWKDDLCDRLAPLQLPPDRERAILEELAHHLDDDYRGLITAGVPEPDARRQALAGLNRSELLDGLRRVRVPENPAPPVADSASTHVFGGMLQDFRYAARVLRRSPGFSLVAVLTLALGIGANTAIFSIVDAVLLRPLPYVDSQQLVKIWGRYAKQDIPQNWISEPEWWDMREVLRSFSGMAAYANGRGANFTREAGEPVRVTTTAASADLFPLLGVRPHLGRAFAADEDQPGRDHVALLDYAFWKAQMAGDPSAVGRNIQLNGETYTILGVLPEGFVFGGPANLWIPLALDRTKPGNRGNHYLEVIARLAPGSTAPQAGAELESLTKRLAEQFPRNYGADTGFGMFLRPLREELVGDIRPLVMVLFAAVTFVLLIACINLANLLLARSSVRTREIAVRAAVGASRMRLVRQLVAESLLIAALGGACGVLLAIWATAAFGAAAAEIVPTATALTVDPRVLAYAGVVSMVTGILFGLAPAWQTVNPRIYESLKDAARDSSPSRGRGLRSGLVVAEIAVALVLLVTAGLMVRSLKRLLEVSPGFRAEHLLTARVSLPQATYTDSAATTAFFRNLQERLQVAPGVQAVGMTSLLPMTGRNSSGSTFVERTAVTGLPLFDLFKAAYLETDQRAVTPGFFEAMQIPLVRGRLFTVNDARTSPPVIIVDQELARRFWPGRDPIGERLAISAVPNSNPPAPLWRTVVGVVGHVKNNALDQQGREQSYFPLDQAGFRISSMYVTIRSVGDPVFVASTLRSEVRTLDASLPVYEEQTMDALLGQSVSQRRVNMLLLVGFGALALVLAAIGTYGVMAYSVSQRRQEIGIRMALGATRSEVLRMILFGGLRVAALGIAIGVLLAAAATRFLSSLLYGVRGTDPATFAFTIAVLLAAALAASYVPARRAMRVDPMVALRYE